MTTLITLITLLGERQQCVTTWVPTLSDLVAWKLGIGGRYAVSLVGCTAEDFDQGWRGHPTVSIALEHGYLDFQHAMWGRESPSSLLVLEFPPEPPVWRVRVWPSRGL